ncbi:MAG TPA: aspartyl-phosphate phosphatase Spo0E family protein [Desulfosporosinus sp.]|nr:aspartyl-phosphate phosphatase Spo0E family protein [Desulfosporosinus sp.]
MKPSVLDQIEELRLEMQKIASDKDLTDPRVVRVSEKLDALISKFYFCQRKKNFSCSHQ